MLLDESLHVSRLFQRFCEHFLKCVIRHYLRNYIIAAEFDTLSVGIENIKKYTLKNLNLCLDNLENFPFSITVCKVKSVTFTYKSLNDIQVDISDVLFTLDVSKRPETKFEETEINDYDFDTNNIKSSFDEDEEYPNGFEPSLDFTEKKVIQSIQEKVEKILSNVKCTMKDISIILITDIGVSSNAMKHTILANISKIAINGLKNIELYSMVVFVCKDCENISIPYISMVVDDNGNVQAKSNKKEIQVDLCGDSYFIFSFFLQLFLENQRFLAALHLKKLQKEQFENITEKIEQGLNDRFNDTFNIEYEKKKVKDKSTFGLFEFNDLNLRIDFHRGSDLQGTRQELDKISVQIFGCSIKCHLILDKIDVKIEKILSTVGYVDNELSLTMIKSKNVWDVQCSVPSINIQTSQHIINVLLILMNFNVLWNEYELLFETDDVMRFGQVIFEDVHVKVKYNGHPHDNLKSIKGNWKNLLKIIPPCDISITLPRVILNNYVGWENLINAYSEELLSTQKFKCAKKVVIGVTKRKVKNLFSI